eukprot:3941417-Rhodomonas_salina.3
MESINKAVAADPDFQLQIAPSDLGTRPLTFSDGSDNLCQAQKRGREFDVRGRFTFWSERKDMAGKHSEALGYCVLLRSLTYGPMYPNS